ncbi:MAG: hypothetical protein U1F15_02360 [Burkholderiales bacterium]
MADDVVISGERDLEAVLASLARTKRMVFFAGLPGVGKSLFIRELGLAAHAAGRTVHLLQWDLARPTFVSDSMAARYPERDGETHALIRMAVGRWARGAVVRWNRERPGAAHLLIGEVPIVGNRLLDLVQVQADGGESLLAGPEALFVTPVPSTAVRAAIEGARGRTIAKPNHPRESADAPPNMVQLAWREVQAAATAIGAAPPDPDRQSAYDPAAYAAVYRRLLRHRRALTLRVEARLEPRTSVYDRDFDAIELLPTADEAAAAVAQLERECTVAEIERETARWFDRV